jgi:malonyl CoA-acyl carrier protein transacylase
MTDALRFAASPIPVTEQRNDASRAAWLFPGLGCRHVGMGHDLFGRPGAVGQLMAQAEEVLGYRLEPVCLEGSGRKVVPARQEAQIIYVLSCAYAAALDERGIHPAAVLGHSLGSWAAAWVAGVYDFVTGLELVTHVEQLLEELVDSRDLTMGAVIGLDEITVQSLVAEQPGVSVANFNSPAQFVIGGPGRGVDEVLQAATLLGAKQARRLPTSRAVHTPWLAEVTTQLKPRLDLAAWSDPAIPFIACDSTEELGTGAEVRSFFSDFLTRPVRWESSFRSLCHTRTSQFVEVGPGTLLTSMASFIIPTAAIRTATDCLDAAP